MAREYEPGSRQARPRLFQKDLTILHISGPFPGTTVGINRLDGTKELDQANVAFIESLSEVRVASRVDYIVFCGGSFSPIAHDYCAILRFLEETARILGVAKERVLITPGITDLNLRYRIPINGAFNQDDQTAPLQEGFVRYFSDFNGWKAEPLSVFRTSMGADNDHSLVFIGLNLPPKSTSINNLVAQWTQGYKKAIEDVYGSDSRFIVTYSSREPWYLLEDSVDVLVDGLVDADLLLVAGLPRDGKDVELLGDNCAVIKTCVKGETEVSECTYNIISVDMATYDIVMWRYYFSPIEQAWLRRHGEIDTTSTAPPPQDTTAGPCVPGTRPSDQGSQGGKGPDREDGKDEDETDPAKGTDSRDE